MNILQTLRVLPLFLILFMPLFAHAQSQSEMDREACAKYSKDDAELNRLYQQVLSDYKEDVLFIEKLRAAQRAWIAFRDTHVEAQYPARDPRRAYGSVYPMCRCEALTELTRQRSDELRRWVTGLEAGDVCAGSIKIRGYTGSLQRRVRADKRTKRISRERSLVNLNANTTRALIRSTRSKLKTRSRALNPARQLNSAMI